MVSPYLRLAAVVAVFCGALRGLAQSPPSLPSLGSAASFAVLGGSAVTNTGATKIAGNVGVSPGSTVTGLSRSNFILGDVFSNDSLARQAQTDNAAAYAGLTALPCKTTLTGDMTLPPGVYCLPSSAMLTGSLVLDADGHSDAVWIFQVPDSLTTATASTVETIRDGRDSNVFWRVGGSVTLGAKSVFAGNVLALTSISLETGAVVSGRLLAQTGAVTLDDNGVTICCAVLDITPHLLRNGTSGVPYSETLTARGGRPPYTFAAVPGLLPPGFSLSSAGVLSGTPATAGVFKAGIVVTDADGVNCIRIYRFVVCGPIALSPLRPPDLVACTRYDGSIVAEGGTEPYRYSLTFGTLPSGLTGPSPSGVLSGVISGTPSAGDYDFTVTATDVFGCTGSRRYTGTITGGLVLSSSPDPPPDGTVDVEYSVTFTATGGTDPTFEFSGYPDGLTPLGGTLAGKPKSGGCYTIVVTVTTPDCLIKKSYPIVIRPVVTFSPESLRPGKVCTRYDAVISASGCTGPYTFDEPPLGSFPPGLEFKAGVISGTPTKPGHYEFTVVAGGESRDYSIDVGCPPITIETELPVATACAFYEHQFPVARCPAPYTLSAAPGALPKGLKFEGGLLSGTPELPGDYTFDITVTAGECPPAVFHVHLKVECLVTLSPPTLPAGHLGLAYDQTITACGGTPPYTFTLLSGTLPTGLTLSPDGNVSGIPLALGCFTFTVRATDSLGCFGDRTYEICIVPPGIGAPALSKRMAILLALLLAFAGVVAMRSGGV